jgi:hypothetical protein
MEISSRSRAPRSANAARTSSIPARSAAAEANAVRGIA